MKAIRVPSLAENVNEATVGAWLVVVGQPVRKGQDLVELITEKADFTLESEEEGVVTAVLAPPKSVMPVGSILCVLDASEDEVTRARESNERKMGEHLDAPTVEIDLRNPDALMAAPDRKSTGVRATPAARRLAKELGVNLEDVANDMNVKGAIKEEHIREFLEG
ncbi:MAG: E3 binding domain-containing protein [Planctomycetes bacterium]|nr:E3 binding domain-containing protein [Planctomycetota bacterium]